MVLVTVISAIRNDNSLTLTVPPSFFPPVIPEHLAEKTLYLLAALANCYNAMRVREEWGLLPHAKRCSPSRELSHLVLLKFTTHAVPPSSKSLQMPCQLPHYSWIKIRPKQKFPKEMCADHECVECNDGKYVYGNPGDCRPFSDPVQIWFSVKMDGKHQGYCMHFWLHTYINCTKECRKEGQRHPFSDGHLSFPECWGHFLSYEEWRKIRMDNCLYCKMGQQPKFRA